MWEPNSDLNKYGTPMVLMTIPYFTQHQSMEGLYFDSSITTPFHFLTVSGLAERPSNPVGGLSYINGDFDKGIRLMKELGIDYYVAFKNETNYKVIEGIEVSKINKIENSNLEVKNLKIDSKSISFETNSPNQLHLIKVSYFPNWKIIDGEGPYRISPSFMAVVPNSNSVSLVFENSGTEKTLNYLSFISLSLAIIIFNRKRKGIV